MANEQDRFLIHIFLVQKLLDIHHKVLHTATLKVDHFNSTKLKAPLFCRLLCILCAQPQSFCYNFSTITLLIKLLSYPIFANHILFICIHHIHILGLSICIPHKSSKYWLCSSNKIILFYIIRMVTWYEKHVVKLLFYPILQQIRSTSPQPRPTSSIDSRQHSTHQLSNSLPSWISLPKKTLSNAYHTTF